MVNVEDYNPLIIGMKLSPGMPLDIIGKNMKGVLESKGYITPREQILPTSFPIKFNSPLETLGMKDYVEVSLNLQTESFNIRGETPENVKKIFEETLNSFIELGYEDISDVVPFYELNATIGIKSDENPLITLNNSLKIDLDKLNEVNPQTSLIGLRIGSIKVNLEKSDNIDLLIEPKKGSHSNRYLVKLTYQTKNKENILGFDIEDQVKTLISSLEEGAL